MRHIILDSRRRTDVASWAVSRGFRENFSDIAVLFCRDSNLPLDGTSRAWLQQHGYTRVFENAYLPSEATELERSQLVQLLFRELGPIEYEASIDLATNVGCYEHLYRVAQDVGVAETPRLLDFGAGPGTILHSSIPTHVGALFGYDFSALNQARAEARGLRMIRPGYSTGETFDLVLSCYVFHYGSLQISDLNFVSGLLKSGGVWVGNFHKGLGTANAVAQLSSHSNFSVEELRASNYGPVVVLRRLS